MTNNAFNNIKEKVSISELVPGWTITGNDLGEFYKNLEDLDCRTQYDKCKLNELSFLSILSDEEVKELGYNPDVIPKKEKWPILPLSKFSDHTDVSLLRKDGIIPEGENSEKLALFSEIEGVGGIIARPVAVNETETRVVSVPISSWAFNDLADRAGISCTNISKRSLNRDKWLVEGFNASDITLVSRVSKNKRMKKILAVRGRIYEGFRQRPYVQSVQEFLEQDLGAATCIGWTISNEKVSLTLAFNEKKKEIKDFYPELSDKDLTPIVTITTSDIGQSAFKVNAGFRVGNFDLLLKSGSVSKIHDSYFKKNTLLKEVEKKCYNEFIAVPKEFARLLAIDVKHTASAIEEVLDFIKMEKKEGLARIKKAVQQQLEQEMSFGRYTAYDIVNSLLTIQDRLVLRKMNGDIREMAESTKARLVECIGQAIFCPFDTAKDEEYFLMPE